MSERNPLPACLSHLAQRDAAPRKRPLFHRDDLRAFLTAHGGSVHGPNVETVSIPEEKYFDMMTDFGTFWADDRLRARIEELESLINNPLTSDWFDGARIEAAHQIERWGSDHDAGKSPLDWFWLVGYLAQKAATSQMNGDVGKAKHHTISAGAAMLNWFRAIGGDNRMRPGIEPPNGESEQ